MSTVSNFNIKITVDSKSGVASIDGFEKAAKGSLADIEKSAKKAGDSFLNMSNIIKGAGLAALGMLGAKAIQGAAQVETLTTQIGTMLGSMERGGKLLEDVKKFGAETPFELPELAQTTKQLLAYEVAEKDVMGVMKQLGDIAAGSGADLQSLSVNYGRVMQSGIASLEDLNQIADKGIPIMSMLSKQYGVGTAELKKMASTGQISGDAVAQAFDQMTTSGGMFFEGAANQSKTLEGMLSTIKDNIGNFLADAATPFLGIFKDLLEILSPIIKQLSDYLVPIFEDLSGVLAEILPPFGELLNNILKALEPVIGVVLKLIGKLAPIMGKLATAASGLLEALSPMLDVITEMAEEQMETFVELLDAMLDIFISLIPVINLAAKVNAVLMRVGSDFVRAVIDPIISGIRFIIEQGAAAAGWIAKIFGGEAADRVAGKKPSKYSGIDPNTGLPVSGPGSAGYTEPPTGTPPTAGPGPAGKAGPFAGSIPAMEAAIKVMEDLRDKTKAGSDDWINYTLKIAAAQAELDMFTRMAEDLTGTGPQGKGISPFALIGQDIALLPEIAGPAIDATVSIIEELGSAWDKVGETVVSVLDSIGTLFSSNFEEMKAISLAQAIINTALGVSKALGQGGIWGIAGAVTVGLAGLAQIKTIMKTTPGSSGGGEVPSGTQPAQEGNAPTRGMGGTPRRLQVGGGGIPNEIRLRADGGDLVGAMQYNTRQSERGGV